MGKKIKKGTKGASVNYMTRAQALKKLQISLKEFRKLCILKGVYPREPKKAPKGKDKTYYFRKDILFLLHDPLMTKFRERHAWKKKLTKARAKKQLDIVKSLREKKPTYSLNHLVRERYPTFVDALRDLDDPLCHISLFAQMPATLKIHAYRVANCQRLSQEFKYYVVKSHALRKVFLSIKGIYYQAEVMGQTVTWLAPYQFAQKVTDQVDYKVMLSFLEFYEVLLSFTNFKLYHTLGLVYPPELDGMALKSERGPIRTIPAQKQTEEESSNSESDSEEENKQVEEEDEEESSKDSNDSEADMDVFANDESVKLRQQEAVYSELFKDCVFWLGREVPKDSLEFVILAFGGSVFWEDFGKEDDPRITHQIIDRPKVLGKQHITREYVQPQWVYDCINNVMLLPTEPYGVGAKLPPHLSPFVDDVSAGYVPDYRLKLDRLKAGGGEEVEENEPEAEMEEDTDDEEAYAEELAQEKGGKYNEGAKEARVSKRKREEALNKAEEDDQIDTAESLLPARRRRILHRMKLNKRMQEDDIFKLEDKRNKLVAGAAKVGQDGIIEYTTETQ